MEGAGRGQPGCPRDAWRLEEKGVYTLQTVETADTLHAGGKDFQQTIEFLKSMGRRKSAPDHSMPSELFLLAMDPTYRTGRGVRPNTRCAFKGAVAANGAPKLNSDFVRLRFEGFFSMIRRLDGAPLLFHRSKAVALDKHNGKPRMKGLRYIHSLCRLGNAFFLE